MLRDSDFCDITGARLSDGKVQLHTTCNVEPTRTKMPGKGWKAQGPTGLECAADAKPKDLVPKCPKIVSRHELKDQAAASV